MIVLSFTFTDRAGNAQHWRIAAPGESIARAQFINLQSAWGIKPTAWHLTDRKGLTANSENWPAQQLVPLTNTLIYFTATGNSHGY
jgi:hypothetical protein